MKNINLAGCVILYNPDLNTVRNIESYIKYLKILYIVDNQNGCEVIRAIKQKYSNIHVIIHKENMGIAYSLNEVLQLCKDKYSHLLTMDQDSCFYNDSMAKYCREIEKFNWNNTLGIGTAIINTASAPPVFL